MKRILLPLCCVFTVVILLAGCGGNNSGTSGTIPSSSVLESKDKTPYLFGPSLTGNFRGANVIGPVLFLDMFKDATYIDAWGRPVVDPTEAATRYDIVQENGVLNLRGDAVLNECVGFNCQGRIYTVSNYSTSASSPMVIDIDFDTKDSVAVTSSIVSSGIMLSDAERQNFSLQVWVSPDPSCSGDGGNACLKVGYSSPVTGEFYFGTLKAGINPLGHWSITYQDGEFIVSFNDSVFSPINPGFKLVGGVNFVLTGGTEYTPPPYADVNPAAVKLNTKFDNFSLRGGFFTTCDVTTSKNTLEYIKQETGNLQGEVRGEGSGFAQQLFSIIRAGLDKSINFLNEGEYTSAMNSLRGVAGRFFEVQETLVRNRGKNINPASRDRWLEEIASLRGELAKVINEVAICKTPVTPPPVLTSIEILPTIWSMTVGDTKSFTAKCYYSKGPSSDCTSVITWNSSNTTTANFTTSTQPNLLEALAKGTTNITATSQGITSNIATVSVSSSSIVSTEGSVYSTAFDKIKIVRDSIGNLYFAYGKKYRGDPQIFVAKSTNNGNTWSDMSNAPIQHIQGHEQYYPSVVIDSQDNIHIVWQGYDRAYTPYYQIKYSKYNGSSWSVWTNIQPTQYYNQSEPMITIDSQDNLHVVWYGYDSANPQHSQIKYSKYSGGSWSAWTNIQHISGYEQNAPAIAVDSQNNLHVVWYGTDSGQYYYQIKYSKYSGGIWSTWTNIQIVFGADAAQYRPSIAIDSQDNIHVVWRGRTDVDSPSFQIKYSRYSAGGWSTWTNIQPIYWYNQLEPTIAIDATDRLHVIWPGYDAGNPDYLQIKYTSCVNNCENFASWSSWINKTSSAIVNQGQPTFRWSRWNNNGGSLNWGWMDGTTVMFDKDTSITMPN